MAAVRRNWFDWYVPPVPSEAVLYVNQGRSLWIADLQQFSEVSTEATWIDWAKRLIIASKEIVQDDPQVANFESFVSGIEPLSGPTFGYDRPRERFHDHHLKLEGPEMKFYLSWVIERCSRGDSPEKVGRESVGVVGFEKALLLASALTEQPALVPFARKFAWGVTSTHNSYLNLSIPNGGSVEMRRQPQWAH